MSTSITSSMTGGQKKQYERLVEDAGKHGMELALEKVETDSAGWQRVIEFGDELKLAIAEVIVSTTRRLSISNEFADEETESTYGYLSGYKPKTVAEQLAALYKPFPHLVTANDQLANNPLPAGAEGWFVIPRWELIAPTYGAAVEQVLGLIKKARKGKFTNYQEGELGDKQLRISSRTAMMFQRLAEQQPGNDLLVVPAQFGLRYRGKSVRRSRATFLASEFGLGAFAIGIMLLTHPERLKHYDDLWIDCAGDEFAPGAGGVFGGAPIFYFDDDGVEFDTGHVGGTYGSYGSVSGFLPQ